LEQDYQTLTRWLTQGYKWNGGIPQDHLGSEGFVVEDQVVVAMGFIGYVENSKFAFMTHMVANPEVSALKKARAIKLIMTEIVQRCKARYGDNGGVCAVYSHPLVISCAKQVGFTEATEAGYEDKFLYNVFSPRPEDYLND